MVMNLKEDLQLECNIKVAARLKQLRLEHGFSIKELSQRTGKSQYILSRTEKCLRLVKPFEILLIAEAYDLDWVELSIEISKIYEVEVKEILLERKKALLLKEHSNPKRS